MSKIKLSNGEDEYGCKYVSVLINGSDITGVTTWPLVGLNGDAHQSIEDLTAYAYDLGRREGIAEVQNKIKEVLGVKNE